MSTAVAGPAQRDLMTLGAITTTVAAWASAFVVIRWAGESFSPGPMALGRPNGIWTQAPRRCSSTSVPS